MDFFGLDLTSTTGDDSGTTFDQNDILNAFSEDIILEEPTTASTESVTLIHHSEVHQHQPINLLDAANLAAQAAAASSFAAISCSVQVPKIPEPFNDVPVQKVKKAFKAPVSYTHLTLPTIYSV